MVQLATTAAVVQVFVGRIAMIGFAAALVGEVQTGGKGPLGQLALPIHTPIGSQLAGRPACHVPRQDDLLYILAAYGFSTSQFVKEGPADWEV